jgi:very-short-patch-repair endonuclease
LKQNKTADDYLARLARINQPTGKAMNTQSAVLDLVVDFIMTKAVMDQTKIT